MSEITLSFRSPIPASAEDLFAWHARPGAFDRLTPSWANVQVMATEGTIHPGDWKRLRIGAGPLRFDWTVAHEPASDGLGFDDLQVAGPFRSWQHQHRFLGGGPVHSTLVDRITYQLPLTPLAQLVAGPILQRRFEDLFHFRHRRTQHDLARHTTANLPRPQRVAISGASGLVGSHLVPFLQAGGHDVFRLVRHATGASDEIPWDPGAGQIDLAALEGMDAVIHLAGTSIAGGRWTPSRKRAILESRVRGTRLLAETLAGLDRPPRVLISASAIGYYGDGGNAVLTEESPRGDGFLAEVCQAWEDAAAPAAAAGIRVVHPRFGVVLSGSGGMLNRLAPLARLGLGGPLGSGQQFMSWIALDDLLGILLHAVADDYLAGPINAVAPHAVTNRDFSETLGRVLGRPAALRTPAPALRLAAGELADELLLVSQRARPAHLEADGFTFASPTLEDALRFELGRFASRGAEQGVQRPASLPTHAPH